VNVLVAGYGSIGRRHVKVLQGLGQSVAVVSRQNTAPLRAYQSLKEALNQFDPGYIVVATPTSEHYAGLEKLRDLGFRGKVLVEKPLFAYPASMPAYPFAGLFVGYNLRFHAIMTELRAAISQSEPLAAYCYTGQWLPDWRPDQDYRKTYSARKQMGGGVLRDLSHDLDYLCWLLGRPVAGCALLAKVSDLEIDSEDYCSLLFETERGVRVALHLNYLDTTARRELIVHTRAGTYSADFMNGVFASGKDAKTVAADRDQSYIEMHQAVLRGDDTDRLCDADEGLRLVDMIDAFERSSASRAWVTL
jgi:predicted dehydrogenase